MKSCVRATNFEFSHRFEVFVQHLPLYLAPDSLKEISVPQQATVWCKVKRKIDERDFVSFECVQQKGTGRKRFHPHRFGIKATTSGEKSFRIETVSQEKSSDFLKQKNRK